MSTPQSAVNFQDDEESTPLWLKLVIVFTSVITFAIIYKLLGADHFSSVGDDTLLDYIYFSVVVQSSVGFGDIYPTTPIARAVAICQAFSTLIIALI